MQFVEKAERRIGVSGSILMLNKIVSLFFQILAILLLRFQTPTMIQ
nr:MAG TPA: hypothetical protein [Caudoviricetes sp.]